MASGHEEPQPHQAARTVEMGYAYETGQPGQPGIRWVARLTEFLRSTSTRTSGLQGRMLEGLGLTATQAAHSPALQAQNNIPSAQQQLQRPQHLAMMSPMRAAAQAVGVGEAPAPPPPPPPPIYDRPLPPLPGPDPTVREVSTTSKGSTASLSGDGFNFFVRNAGGGESTTSTVCASL